MSCSHLRFLCEIHFSLQRVENLDAFVKVMPLLAKNRYPACAEGGLPGLVHTSWFSKVSVQPAIIAGDDFRLTNLLDFGLGPFFEKALNFDELPFVPSLLVNTRKDKEVLYCG